MILKIIKRLRSMAVTMLLLLIVAIQTANSQEVDQEYCYYQTIEGERVGLIVNRALVRIKFQSNMKRFVPQSKLEEAFADGFNWSDNQTINLKLKEPLGSDQLNDIRKLFPDKPEIDFVSFALTPENDKTSFYATNTVVLELKSGVNKSDLDKVLDQYSITGKKESYGMITFKAKDVGEAFKISHELLRSGTVIWAQPDFIEKLKKAYETPQFDPIKFGSTIYKKPGRFEIPKFTTIKFGPTLYKLKKNDKVRRSAPIKWTSHFNKKAKEMNLEPSEELYKKGIQFQLSDSNRFGINVKSAWKLTKGCSNIKVAIMDDGLPIHPDLPNHRVDLDFSQSGVESAVPYEDKNDHGLAVAAIIGAAHNGIGIAGVAPNCELFGIRKRFGELTESNFSFAKAIRKAVERGADVINLSFTKGGEQLPPIIESSLRYAVNDGRNGLGCVIVTGTGNDGKPVSSVLALNEYTISVGAIGKHGNILTYSNFLSLDLVAPSGGDNNVLKENVILPMRDLNYERTGVFDRKKLKYQALRGTSFSTPLVSGVAALMLSVNPDLTQSEVREIIVNTAIDQNNRFRFGAGLLNAHAAVRAAINRRADSTAVVCADTVDKCSPFNFNQLAESGHINFDLQNVPDTLKFTTSLGRLSFNSANVRLTLPNPYRVTENTMIDVAVQNDNGRRAYTALRLSSMPESDVILPLPDASFHSFRIPIGDSFNGVVIREITFMNGSGFNAKKTTYAGFKIYEKEDCQFSRLIREDLLEANAHRLAEIKVYPNPTAGSIEVVSEIEGKVELYNMAGHLVKTTRITTDNNRINLSDIPNGIYQLTLTSKEGSVVSERILKQ